MKIADLGLSVFIPSNPDFKLKEVCGSPTYVAPEILKKEGYRETADIFSVGSLLFNLITGRYLFSGEGEDELLKQNLKCDLSRIDKYLLKMSPVG